MFARYIASDAVARTFARDPHAEINTDDRNIVEFGLGRSVGRSTPILVAELRQVAASIGASRPPLDADAGISWPAVETAWANFVGWGIAADPGRGLPPIEQARQAALRQYFHLNDPAGAREIWRQQTEPPRDPSELAMAADLEAEAGSDTALPLIDQLRAYRPAEADIVLATLRQRQLRMDEAAAALQSAFARLRTDPWPMFRFKQKALSLSVLVSGAHAAAARPLYDALAEPFSLRAVDNVRLMTRLELSARFDFKGTCRAPIDPLEPHVPWTGHFLTLRRDCYQQNDDPRLPVANRELNEFMAHEPLPIAPR
jgi:hypothetical protein